LAHLLSHDWPGNVRELANVAERQVLGLASRTGRHRSRPVPGRAAGSLRSPVPAAALTRHKGDIKAVLAELQLPRRTLNEKMQRHGLTVSKLAREDRQR
jgi:two-component system C4-dicarboxylate transport response regulator DctD